MRIRTLKWPLSFCCCSILLVAGCSKRERSSETPEAKPAEEVAQKADQPIVDACTLLTSEEVAAIQGEAVKETKKAEKSEGGLLVSQCYFVLPTHVNSINLGAVQRARDEQARDPRQVWKETFAPEKLEEKGPDGKVRKGLPERIPNLGEDAFWRDDRRAGVLYVLKGNAYLRLTIGGADDKETKIKKCSELARKALSRL